MLSHTVSRDCLLCQLTHFQSGALEVPERRAPRLRTHSAGPGTMPGTLGAYRSLCHAERGRRARDQGSPPPPPLKEPQPVGIVSLFSQHRSRVSVPTLPPYIHSVNKTNDIGRRRRAHRYCHSRRHLASLSHTQREGERIYWTW